MAILICRDDIQVSVCGLDKNSYFSSNTIITTQFSKMFSSISALLVITASLEFVCVYCLNNNLSRRIIGGHDSEDYWPFYVNITWTDTETGGPGGCGGILIDEQHILSAAHFFYGSPVLYGKYFVTIFCVQ